MASLLKELKLLQIFITSSFLKIHDHLNASVGFINCFCNRELTDVLLSVYGVFILDCIQTLLLTIDMFDNFVYRWGSSKSFSTIGTGWFSFIILGGVISAIVQCSFSWRLWILARSKILTGGIAMVCALLLLDTYTQLN